MRITVIGAGAIGSAIAQELAARQDITRLQVCDVRARLLQDLHERVDSRVLRSFQIDARDTSVLESIIAGSACVVACVPPAQNLALTKLCLDQGIHFCDLGGNDEVVKKQLDMAEEARKKSTWIVPNCGLAPGLINILCLHGLEQFDAVTAAHLRVGDVPLHPEPPFNFRISWSAEKIIEDYTNPVQCIENGRVREMKPLTCEERIRFGAPFEEMEAFCTQGGLSTLASALEGRLDTLDHKTIRWPGHANQMRFLLGLGFGEDRTIDVRTHLTYRDVLTRRMRQRLGGAYEDAVLMRVLIQGQKEGRAQTLTYEMAERYDAERGLTAMKKCTSVPTAVIAGLLASGEIHGGGAAPPEDVVPKDAYLAMIRERGLTIAEHWREDHAHVTTPSDGVAQTAEAP